MNELEVKQAQMPAEMMSEFQADFQIDSADILIPKILLMQPSSEAVADEKANLGDFINSVTLEKVGSIVQPFEFVPFWNTKVWDIVNKDDNNAWMRTEEFLPGQDNMPWEFKDEEGTNCARIKRLNFFGFIPSKVEAGEILPYILSFKSTSYREGTKILTQWKLNMSKQMVPFCTSFEIAGEKLKNEKAQTYCVSKVMVKNPAVSQEMIALCMKWYKDIKQTKVKVQIDDSDLNSKEQVVSDETTGRF
jgi:hypothetical protein